MSWQSLRRFKTTVSYKEYPRCADMVILPPAVCKLSDW